VAKDFQEQNQHSKRFPGIKSVEGIFLDFKAANRGQKAVKGYLQITSGIFDKDRGNNSNCFVTNQKLHFID